MTRADKSPVACVLGGMDTVRPLGKAGIRCWVLASAGKPVRYSRFVDGVIDYVDPWQDPQGLAERLISFAEQRSARPVLYYENDGYLEMTSRFRDALGTVFRFVLPARDLVDDLIDKARFARLAQELSLPVPPSWTIAPDTEPDALRLKFPILIKPLTRRDRDNGWVGIGGDAKALEVSGIDVLNRLMPKLRSASISVLAQTIIPGREASVESYHVYAREGGAIAADFTGRKLRTLPHRFGHSTALVTTSAPDVTNLGRAIVRRLGLSGVAKLDFKRDPDGKVHLLEVNPRFTLWNHLGAEAGVNIPSLVYDDLTGQPPTHLNGARAGITWCDLPKDFRAARGESLPLTSWFGWAVRANIKTDFAVDDPMPFLQGRIISKIGRAHRRLRSRSGGASRRT